MYKAQTRKVRRCNLAESEARTADGQSFSTAGGFVDHGGAPSKFAEGFHLSSLSPFPFGGIIRNGTPQKGFPEKSHVGKVVAVACHVFEVPENLCRKAPGNGCQISEIIEKVPTSRRYT